MHEFVGCEKQAWVCERDLDYVASFDLVLDRCFYCDAYSLKAMCTVTGKLSTVRVSAEEGRQMGSLRAGRELKAFLVKWLPAIG